jgi:7-carboxy-7-deazaguanine synthase
VAEAEEWECRHVVITGGEPMLFAEMIPLCDALRERGRHITIETAGTLYLPVACDLMSISPKLAGSAPHGVRHARWRRRHHRERYRPEVISQLLTRYECQLKFVVDAPEDVAEVSDYLGALPAIRPECVMLMPQGRTAEEVDARTSWVLAACRAYGWSYCPRKQLEWFGPLRQT